MESPLTHCREGGGLDTRLNPTSVTISFNLPPGPPQRDSTPRPGPALQPMSPMSPLTQDKWSQMRVAGPLCQA